MALDIYKQFFLVWSDFIVNPDNEVIANRVKKFSVFFLFCVRKRFEIVPFKGFVSENVSKIFRLKIAYPTSPSLTY